MLETYYPQYDRMLTKVVKRVKVGLVSCTYNNLITYKKLLISLSLSVRLLRKHSTCHEASSVQILLVLLQTTHGEESETWLVLFLHTFLKKIKNYLWGYCID